ncbi:MAG: hypothetical protein J5J06_20275 [Phycisphaerae bacterium]|nr:hypothetical protein [Phycisphaerae bacterium]
MRVSRSIAGCLAVIAVAASTPFAMAIGNNICTNPNYTIPSPGATNANGDAIIVNVGQVAGAGATLFVDFFLTPASTNDWIDVDGDMCSGFNDTTPPTCPTTAGIVDQLTEPYFDGIGTLDTELLFNYRSVGSVRGFDEFVDSQVCGAIPLNRASEAGIFNRLQYSNASTILFTGTPDNPSGTPLTQCEIEFSFLDVFASWGVIVPGSANWFIDPTRPGYGDCPIPNTAGGLSALQSLSRDCYLCTDGVTPCVTDRNCLPPDTCDTGTVITSGSLNQNTTTPLANSDSIYSEVGAWVAVGIIGNRGTGKENVKFSELQNHFVTGRFPNGENLVGATRDVGSGTRNAAMNSLGIDTSWGRGDNIGNRVDTENEVRLGPGTQPSNCGGSGIMERSVRSHRLAIGYTGLSGSSRIQGDVPAGQYEMLNVCQDVESPGICDLPTRDQCTPTTPCPGGAACLGYQAPCDCSTPASFIRAGTDNVLNNCDACTSYRIAGSGSFVFRGNRDRNRDPLDPNYNPDAGQPALDNDAVAAYANNIFDSIQSFGTSPLFIGQCSVSAQCSTAGTRCNTAADCPGGETCDLVGCDIDADCPYDRCSITTTQNCVVNADCPVGETCTGGNDDCDLKFNMPGEYLAQEFFLRDAMDCLHQFDGSMTYLTNANLVQDLQDYISINSAISIPAYGTVNPAGEVPDRLALPLATTTVYSDGSADPFYQYNGGSASSASSFPTIGSGRLSARNEVQGDMDGDGARDLNDATELVKAYYNPRAWQASPVAQGSGALGSMVKDTAIPEVLGDFNGDGSLSKEDLRYFADGLALTPKYCSIRNAGALVSCSVDADCSPSFGVCDKWVDRKAGAIAIDNAILDCDPGSISKVCRNSGLRCTTDADCSASTGPCVCPQLPWALPNIDPFDTPAEILVHAGPLPGPPLPQNAEYDVDAAPFLATGKAYAAGDFRGDVAGRPGNINGRAANAGGNPVGWDGKVDVADIDYCCEKIRAGNWVYGVCPFCDYSCDMNGDGMTLVDDVTVELVQNILGTAAGDINLDGIVDKADLDAFNASACASDCGWTDGDFDCDGVKDAAFPIGNCSAASSGCTVAVLPPTPAPCTGYPDAAMTQRFLCFVPDMGGFNQSLPIAYRVTQNDSGTSYYVGKPRTASPWTGRNISGLSSLPIVLNTFGNQASVKVTNCMIAPSETYTIESTFDGVTFSAPLVLSTTATPTNGRFWGDLVGLFSASGDGSTTPPTPPNSWTPPNLNVSGFDISAALQAVSSLPTAPARTWTDVNPQAVDGVVIGPDVLRIANAFSVGSNREFYPYDHPDGAGCAICGPVAPAVCPVPPADERP